MNNELFQNIEKNLQEIIISHYANKSINIFDKFIQHCQNYYEGPAHSLAEIRLKQNTKLKGDIFEHFALKYFQHGYKVKFTDLWLLKDAPDAVLEKLKLKRHDLGIDILGVDGAGKYYAVQAKYRKRGCKATHGISWKQLSTFYALVNRTGPYARTIVITNTDYVRHIGRKTQQDQSICYGTLSKIPLDVWIEMANFKGQSPGHSISPAIVDTVRTDVPAGSDEVAGRLTTCPTSEQVETKKKIIIKKLVPSTTPEQQGDIPAKKIVIKKIQSTSDLEFLRKKRLEYFSQNKVNKTN